MHVKNLRPILLYLYLLREIVIGNPCNINFILYLRIFPHSTPYMIVSHHTAFHHINYRFLLIILFFFKVHLPALYNIQFYKNNYKILYQGLGIFSLLRNNNIALRQAKLDMINHIFTSYYTRIPLQSGVSPPSPIKLSSKINFRVQFLNDYSYTLNIFFYDNLYDLCLFLPHLLS